MIPERHRTMDGVAPRDNALARGAARWLCLAASPIFALMAFTTAVSASPDMGCFMGQSGSPLTGMALMYLLMSVFHLTPWLKLISGNIGRAG